MIIIWTAIYLYAFWILYLAVMGVYRAWLLKKLSKKVVAFSVPLLAIGYGADIFANWFIAPVVFLDAPRELTVTDRLKRYIRTDKTWRADLARTVCTNLLDVFDPSGSHCESPT